MQSIQIIPLQRKPEGRVWVPGSKSYTNRALIMAALAPGRSKIYGSSSSEDSLVLIRALGKVGIKIKTAGDSLVVDSGQKHLAAVLKINLGAAGTALRFFTAYASLCLGQIILDGSKRMRERPIGDLVRALKQLGVKIKYLGEKGFPPLKIQGGTIEGGKVEMRGSVSSQYISALLMIAPVLNKGLDLKVKGKQISKSYIDMTLDGLQKFGVSVQNRDYQYYRVDPQEEYKAVEFYVEGDASGGSYFWAIAALTGGNARVLNINPDSAQGDVHFPALLGRMGCRVKRNKEAGWIEVEGPPALQAISVNMERMPDTAQTLAVVAAFAQGQSKITGLSSLRVKETDRLAALQKELFRMGIKSKIGRDYILIDGGKPKGAEILTYQDHRMAMAFAVAGARISNMIITDSQVVTKSFPKFWEELEKFGITLKKR